MHMQHTYVHLNTKDGKNLNAIKKLQSDKEVGQREKKVYDQTIGAAQRLQKKLR